MPNCAVSNCKNNSNLVGREKGDISFHRFPTNPLIKEKWIEATGNKDWFPGKHSTICSIHFKKNNYIVASRKCRRLHETACPSINVLQNRTVEENTCEKNLVDAFPMTSTSKKKKMVNICRMSIFYLPGQVRTQRRVF